MNDKNAFAELYLENKKKQTKKNKQLSSIASFRRCFARAHTKRFLCLIDLEMKTSGEFESCQIIGIRKIHVRLTGSPTFR